MHRLVGTFVVACNKLIFSHDEGHIPLVTVNVSLVILCCYFQLLRKCILNMNNPTIEGPLGNPPFEKPSIAKVSFLKIFSLKVELWKQQILKVYMIYC